MKKLLLILIAATMAISINAQTATNFTCDDCNSVSHDLFTELDNGNVIVLCWVMPCGACVSGGLTCSNITATYPSNVKFYMADDDANTVCSSLLSWANNNNIVPDAIFSNASIKMTDYGTAGMPKVVVIGGANHTVFYNGNNSISASGVQNGIDQALLVAGIKEKNNVFSKLSVFPSPANDVVKVNYSFKKSSNISVELYNLEGKKLQQRALQAIAGENTFDLNVEGYASGMYLLKITDGENSQYANIVVSH